MGRPDLDLSIVIAHRNGQAVLSECLTSVYCQSSEVSLHVIVVDNASVDKSPEMVERDFPSARVICNSANMGFARASNQGWRASSTDLILFLNNDTRVPASALSELAAFMGAHPRAGTCGPRLVQKDGRVQPFAFGGDPTPSYLLRRGITRLLLNRPIHNWNTTSCQEVDWVSGACLLVRRQALEQVGGFDEKFFMYFEDNDLCLRLRRAGWKIYYNPLVSITHFGGASTQQSSFRTQWYNASLRYFYAKHYSPLARILLELMLPFYRRMA